MSTTTLMTLSVGCAILAELWCIIIAMLTDAGKIPNKYQPLAVVVVIGLLVTAGWAFTTALRMIIN